MKKIYYLLSICLTIAYTQLSAQCNFTNEFTVIADTSLSISIIDSSSADTGNLVHMWLLGDGDTSFIANPSHTYAKAGKYDICHVLNTDVGSCNDSWYCQTIVVGPTCDISYTYWTDSLNTTYFTSNSYSFISSYSWDFGDGFTDTTANPIYTYRTAGAYGVTLKVVDSIGGDTCEFYDTVYVNYCAANFGYTIGAQGSVSFDNYSASVRNSTSYTWNFGDSTTSSDFDPTHIYGSSGTYNVSLTLFDSLNNCSSTYTDSVLISLATVNCSASFTIEKDSSTQYNIILYNTSTNASSHSYSWDFGDGTTGSGRTPIHTYQSFGSYEVCLTITDSTLGCDTTIYCDTVGMDSLGNLKAGFGIEVRDGLTVGIDEEDDELIGFNIFPNPAKSIINVDLRGRNDVVNIRIVDLSGRIVEERANTSSGNLETFDISNYSKGIYFMMLDNASTQTVEKFIVAN